MLPLPKSMIRSALRWSAGLLLACLLKCWAKSWRVRWVGDEYLALPGSRVFAFWHGQQMGLLVARRRARLTTLVSWSNDGALQAQVMRRLGLEVVRGSSSRGAAVGLLSMIRAVRGGSDAAFAVDGPKGPKQRAKRGALAVAKSSDALLLPIASAARQSVRIGRAWDGFEVPLPFTTVAIAVGPPVESECSAAGSDRLRDAIQSARSAAERVLLESPATLANSLPLS